MIMEDASKIAPPRRCHIADTGAGHEKTSLKRMTHCATARIEARNVENAERDDTSELDLRASCAG